MSAEAGFQMDLSALLGEIEKTKQIQIEQNALAEVATAARIRAEKDLQNILNEIAIVNARFIQESENQTQALLELEKQTKIKTASLLLLSHEQFEKKQQSDSEIAVLATSISGLKINFNAAQSDLSTLIISIESKQKQNEEIGNQISASSAVLDNISKELAAAKVYLSEVKLQTILNIKQQGELQMREVAVAKAEREVSLQWRDIKIMQARLSPEYIKVFLDQFKTKN